MAQHICDSTPTVLPSGALRASALARVAIGHSPRVCLPRSRRSSAVAARAARWKPVEAMADRAGGAWWHHWSERWSRRRQCRRCSGWHFGHWRWRRWRRQWRSGRKHRWHRRRLERWVNIVTDDIQNTAPAVLPSRTVRAAALAWEAIVPSPRVQLPGLRRACATATWATRREPVPA